MNLRSTPEMALVAYFLSRCGVAKEAARLPGPPNALGVNTWDRAYTMFFGRLGSGRTWTVFRNSLKSARDDFDSHVASGRVGWRAKGTEGAARRPPRRLPIVKQKIIDSWHSRTDEELWQAVQPFVDESAQFVESSVIADLAAELDPERAAILVKTEGGRKVVVSIRVERDPSLRTAAIRIHGTTCIVCGFSFGEVYGAWGDGFAIVHHLEPFGANENGERPTNPEADLAVLCANCHCMVHRKKNVALTIEELKAKLRFAFRSGFAPG